MSAENYVFQSEREMSAQDGGDSDTTPHQTPLHYK